MKVEQIYGILNDVTGEMLGDSVVVNEDLSNIVDIGRAFEDAVGYDKLTGALIDKVGRVVFVDRVYSGRVPSVLRDGWEFGSILQKIATRLPEAEENEMWSLNDGQSYNQDIFKKSDVISKFYNDRVTYDVQLSIATEQVKSAFTDSVQLNAFFSMLYNAVNNSMTFKLDGLIMRTINNMIAETVYSETNGGSISGRTGVKAVNLLKLYNDSLPEGDTPLTAEQFIETPDAIRFAVFMFTEYIDRLKVMSNLFNVGGESRFTPEDRLNVVMLSTFKNRANIYLQSDTFHDEYTRLPNADAVTYFQGSGTGYDFNSTSKIDVKTSSGHDVTVTGIIGCMFDRDALGVANLDNKVTSHYNAKADFTNNFYHFTSGFFNDLNENFVVFYVA